MVYIVLERARCPYYAKVCYKVFVEAEPGDERRFLFVSGYDTQPVKRCSNV